jgi:hypothetical protein
LEFATATRVLGLRVLASRFTDVGAIFSVAASGECVAADASED